MKRNIITIDEQKCNGCSQCIPNCPEGAIQIIDGKARLVSDLMCDGLGACLGHCPEGAISVIEREAEPYDERKVMANIVKQGPNTIKAHLKHLKDHNENTLFEEAIQYLEEYKYPVPSLEHEQKHTACPGSKSTSFVKKEPAVIIQQGTRPSELTHWPIQMHLLSPESAHFKGSDMVLAADCVAFSFGDFHKDYLKGKTLGIACPKLDDNLEIYSEKITALIDIAKINTLTVIIMQVPCCGGLLSLARGAASKAERKIPIKCIVIGLQGEVLKEEWV
jgi:NAD-dependent dihydropyrimidine dehydrogenase PreA subunit